ncbi:ethylene-responsive transcription factor ERF017-like [Mercurialis annua]|uniref:ethylene-responsive transcription factor ERF017-like n=1 Tax=Mercurialis annua TaxID=3986 RepID=UPI00215FD0AA|nr:ethylene-responsive transcription factor ERF017-like [Mercurialis annua]
MVKQTTARVEKKPAADRSDLKFKGVRKRKWGKWVCEIRLPNSRERIWLGSYDSPEKAARAFDAALFCLRGRSAKFNFPDNPPEIAGGRSFSPAQIQAAAAKFANSEHPNTVYQSDQSTSELQAESPCTSDSTGQIDWSGLEMDIPFLDLLPNSGFGSDNCTTDYGIFPGFDDFFAPLNEPNLDSGVEDVDGVIAQGSFLWNF